MKRTLIALALLLVAAMLVTSGCRTTKRNVKQLKDDVSVTFFDDDRFDKEVQ